MPRVSSSSRRRMPMRTPMTRISNNTMKMAIPMNKITTKTLIMVMTSIIKIQISSMMKTVIPLLPTASTQSNNTTLPLKSLQLEQGRERKVFLRVGMKRTPRMDIYITTMKLQASLLGSGPLTRNSNTTHRARRSPCRKAEALPSETYPFLSCRRLPPTRETKE